MDAQQTDVDCGCAPTESEKRGLWPTINRRSAMGIGALGALGFLTFSSLAYSPGAIAIEGYPSWEEVEAAKANEAAKAAEVSKIQNLIASLEAEVARTQAEAEAASNEFYEAQQAFFEASFRADELQAQADEQAAAAVEAANKAGRVAAQLYRNGGDDTSLELFFSGSAASADDLLSRLGTMDKMLERNQSVYSDAVTARDAAQSLSDQAEVAREERDRLQKVAEEKMVEAQEKADAAAAALADQESNLGNLQAQLAALQDTTAKTVADYKAGVEEEKRRRAEAERRAREEAERRAREAAERAAQEQQNSGGGGGSGGGGSSGGGGGGGNSGGGGGGGNGGAVIGSGWARPSSGWRTSGYGWRTSQCGPSYCSSSFHAGVDLAAGCGSAIYAASAGRVVYAGWNGGYGNYIKIDHGNGVGTGYAHIRDGGIWVGYGQWVNAGQAIAAEGNTGNSFGCHLHFECYINGSPVNPIDFMGARGIGV